KRNLNLQFRGSSNQRIIDLAASQEQGKAVIWAKCKDAEASYEQIKKQI
ncbi:anaerobic ribonucleoside-triphosphate reductase activating protein, partial [Listeria monocytogenes]|nr:anaerobic ribonucleoside-triphosphate reductase activating protein [Listeria monocytogenes]